MAQEVSQVVGMINDPSVDIIDKAKIYMAYMPTKDEFFGRMRPWVGEFVPDMDSFAMPRGPNQLWARMNANFSRFQFNYMLIAAFMICWSLIATSPFFLVCLTISIGIFYLGWSILEAPIRRYTQNKWVKWGIVAAILGIMVFALLSITTWYSFWAVGIIILHSVLRDEKMMPKDPVAPNGDVEVIDDQDIELLGGQDVENLQRRK
jgi:hypothetical protein